MWGLGSPSALGHTSPSHLLPSILWPGAQRPSLTLKLLRVSLRAEYALELVEIPWGWSDWDSPALQGAPICAFNKNLGAQ